MPLHYLPFTFFVCPILDLESETPGAFSLARASPAVPLPHGQDPRNTGVYIEQICKMFALFKYIYIYTYIDRHTNTHSY